MYGDSAYGFVRTSDRTITSFSVPQNSALQGPNTFTYPESINASGEITGFFSPGFLDSPRHGFVRDSSGQVVSFDVPFSNTATIPMSINDSGAITGWFESSMRIESFILNP